MKKLHAPNHKLYEQYYVDQAKQKGGNLPAFHGARFQRGYGLGSIFKGLFRSAMPRLQQGAKVIGRKALQTGVNVALDVLDGDNIKKAISKQAKQTPGLPEFIAGTIRSWQKSYNKESARLKNQFTSRQERKDISTSEET